MQVYINQVVFGSNGFYFIIQKKNGEVLKTNQINIGWMSQNQLNILNQLVKAQNNPIN